MTAPARDATHDPAARTWVPAESSPSDFPVQNLPFGRFRPKGASPAVPTRLGVAIEGQVLDLAVAADVLHAELDEPTAAALRAPVLNPLLALDPAAWRRLRQALFRLLTAPENPGLPAGALPARADLDVEVPFAVGDYTDFYASIHHARNVGSMFRPDQPLLPNYRYVPIGYHGRASSIVVSGHPVRRPRGQVERAGEGPVFMPTAALDYECELGIVLGGENPLGASVPIAQAGDRIFGYCLVNDWSARDMQRWEYQPLGPFLAKSFATTLSPWVVTALALQPFRCAVAVRGPEDPAPLPYLFDAADQAAGALDLTLEVYLSTAAMRAAGMAPVRVSRAHTRDLYWTAAQMVAHHASNGCNLRPGDLLASGTVSGPTPESRGCLLERTWRGTEPLALPTGEERRFLEDGDEVVLRAGAERPGAARLGFGECRGLILSMESP